jgi:hypothetical protein
MISVCPNAEGGMRFTFPPYTYKKLGTVSLQNNYITKATRCKLTDIYHWFEAQEKISDKLIITIS